MSNILLYVSNIFILLSFIIYFIMIIINRGNKVTNSNGFDITKDIISEYNSINIIESKGYFTFYNIKRKVIKLDTKTYYGNDLSSIVIALISAGISIVHNSKNKYIEFFRKIFSNIKILYIFPLIAILINYSTYNISDAKVSIIFLIFFSIISYILINIKNQAFMWTIDNINKIKDISKSNSDKIVKFIDKIIWLDKFIFFGELIMIIRYVLILLEIN
ncbi:MAG: zinc metallopeptidase [Bacilli bacterium]|nr:zinc metallopeptidase [Bacilli bacterium]